MQRCIKRGVAERTYARNIRSDELPQVNKIYQYSGDALDTVTDSKGVILKFKTDFGITSTWTFAQAISTPTIPAVRGYWSKGIGMGSFTAFVPRPEFTNILPEGSPSFYLQSLLYYWGRNSVTSGMIWENGGRTDLNGVFAGSFFGAARSPQTASISTGLRSAEKMMSDFAQLRNPGVGTTNTGVLGTGNTRVLTSFNKVTGLRLNLNSSSTDLTRPAQSLGIRLEQAELYGRIDYSCANTNKLNKAQSIMRQKQLSKLILNTFGNPLLK